MALGGDMLAMTGGGGWKQRYSRLDLFNVRQEVSKPICSLALTRIA